MLPGIHVRSPVGTWTGAGETYRLRFSPYNSIHMVVKSKIYNMKRSTEYMGNTHILYNIPAAVASCLSPLGESLHFSFLLTVRFLKLPFLLMHIINILSLTTISLLLNRHVSQSWFPCFSLTQNSELYTFSFYQFHKFPLILHLHLLI